MAASEWVFPMKTTSLLQKQLTKGSVCDEQLISDQPGGWLIKEKEKKNAGFDVGYRRGRSSRCRTQKEIDILKVKAVWLFQGDYIDKETKAVQMVTFGKVRQYVIVCLLLHFLNQSCVKGAAMDSPRPVFACVLVPTSRASDSGGLTTLSCPLVGDVLSVSAL